MGAACMAWMLAVGVASAAPTTDAPARGAGSGPAPSVETGDGDDGGAAGDSGGAQGDASGDPGVSEPSDPGGSGSTGVADDGELGSETEAETSPEPARPRLTEREDIAIGRTRRFGLGVAAGFPPSVSFKYLFDRRSGVSVHLGPTFVASGLHTRVQFEQRARTLKDWDFGDLSLTWHAGLVFNLVFGEAVESAPVRPGVAAGVGVQLRLVPAPITAFAEVSPVLFPLDLLPGAKFFPVGVQLAAGARWWF